MTTYIVDNIESLLIWQQLEKRGQFDTPLNKVSTLDVTLLGLKQSAWEFVKGARNIRKYCDDNDREVVQFRYVYEREQNSNVITGYEVIIEWFDNDGNIGVSKTLEKELSRKYLTTFNREVRQNQIDYLVGAGKGFREDADNYPEPTKSELIAFADIVDELWVRYETEILEYVNTGNANLYNIVSNESTNPYSFALDKTDPATLLTMRQTILDQIS